MVDKYILKRFSLRFCVCLLYSIALLIYNCVNDAMIWQILIRKKRIYTGDDMVVKRD